MTYFFLACTFFCWIYWLLCLDSARRWSRRPRTSANGQPLSVLKPLSGNDPELYENLKSFCEQEYVDYEVLFGALESDDPALETAFRLKQDFPHLVGVVTGAPVLGANRKVSNLANLRKHAGHRIFVLADSDMRVAPDYLARIAAPFTDSNVGVVTCPYRGHKAEGVASMLEALGIGADFIPSVILTDRFWGLQFAFGSTIAIRSEIVDRIGGFESMADELADDYLLGAGAARQGLKVILSDCVVDSVLKRESFGEMWSRRLRWARTTRAMHPFLTFGAGLTHGTALSVIYLAATRFNPLGWAVFGCTLAVRGITATLIASKHTHDENLPRNLLLLPVSDLLSFFLWAASFMGNTVVWRGRRFRVRHGGKLQELQR